METPAPGTSGIGHSGTSFYMYQHLKVLSGFLWDMSIVYSSAECFDNYVLRAASKNALPSVREGSAGMNIPVQKASRFTC
jgi:hypothetical protein